MAKKLDLILAIRLQEQLSELIETYELENVKNMLARFHETETEDKKEKALKNKKKDDAQEVKKKAEEKKKQVPSLPPNIRNIEGFEAVINDFAARGKIKPEVFQGLKGFIQNAKLIFSGQYKKVDEAFIINLTSKPDLIQATSPEESWIKYNGEIIRKQLKRKLRLVGYDFMDSEVEVGKAFDATRHNVVGKETVSDSTLDQRVLKVMSEGLIIGRRLHINANVILGNYRPSSY
ncbi:MAG: hypothetical protein M1324_02005 [Patescibacteria group bacterium]|nr:hypothetical protein [Patescibacteria group bacterium]